MENSKFKRVISMYKINEELALKYTSLLNDSAIEIDNCSNCSGLCNCKNMIKGYCNVPIVGDKVINFSYDMCRYLKNESYKERKK